MRNTWLRVAKHASEEDLVLYLDGELKQRQAEWISGHLEACWECRARCEQTQRAICEFVEYRRAALGTYAEGPPGGWKRPAVRPANEIATGSAVSRCKLSPRMSLGFASFAAICLIVAAWWHLNSVATVSANDLLERAASAEAESIRRVQGPVVYRKLAVRRRSISHSTEEAGIVEIWSDAERARLKRQGSDSLWQELQQVFEANGRGGKPPLSAAAHQSWRASVDRKQEQVLPARLAGEGEAWTLRTVAAGPYDPQDIIQDELTVRARDWRPVREALRVQTETDVCEYEITVIAFDTVARNTLPPDLFGERQPFVLSARPTRAPALPPPVQPDAALPSDSVELKSVYALHVAGACRGEPVEVVREATGEIGVRGVVETVQRKRELLAALAVVPGVKAEIQAAEEAREAPPWPGAEAPVVTFETPPLPLGEQLRRYLAERPGSESVAARVAAFSDEAVSLGRGLLAEAWALRRLAERFSGPDEKRMSAASRWLLAVMLQDHMASLRAKIPLARELLEPVLAPIAGLPRTDREVNRPDQEVQAGFDWGASSLEIFRTVERIQILVNGLFAGAGGTGEPAAAAAEILAALPLVEQQLADTEVLLARRLSGADDSAVERAEKN